MVFTTFAGLYLSIKHTNKQTKISLRARCKLTAIKEPATIVLELRDNPPATIQQLKHHLSTYFEQKAYAISFVYGRVK
ncbi:MAG: hypothetical protein ACI88H_000693 [Cocleimonas sp.]|jgi:hypothetical protein